ncbi:MAG: diacylglycerol kinase family protein [Pseudomonadota bacterium]
MGPVFVVNTESRGQKHAYRKANRETDVSEIFMPSLSFTSRDSLILWQPSKDPSQLATKVEEKIRLGHREFVSCGGDGTANAIIQQLLSSKVDLSNFKLGALALGSSNDLHKPFQTEKGRFPGLLDFENTNDIEILKVRVDETSDVVASLNTSIGLTAEANRTFNDFGLVGSWLKRVNVNLAIFLAILKTLFVFRPVHVSIATPSSSFSSRCLNVQFIKQRFFAGDMAYPRPAQNGLFDMYVFEDLSYFQLFKGLLALKREKLPELKGMKKISTNRVRIESPTPIAFEFDGETMRGCVFEISISEQKLKLCRELT